MICTAVSGHFFQVFNDRRDDQPYPTLASKKLWISLSKLAWVGLNCDIQPTACSASSHTALVTTKMSIPWVFFFNILFALNKLWLAGRVYESLDHKVCAWHVHPSIFAQYTNCCFCIFKFYLCVFVSYHIKYLIYI